jgi:hypothetical protein
MMDVTCARKSDRAGKQKVKGCRYGAREQSSSHLQAIDSLADAESYWQQTVGPRGDMIPASRSPLLLLLARYSIFLHQIHWPHLNAGVLLLLLLLLLLLQLHFTVLLTSTTSYQHAIDASLRTNVNSNVTRTRKRSGNEF